MIDKRDIDFAIKHQKTVLLVGHQGCGKTSIVRSIFKSLGLEEKPNAAKYFSCATLDPWVDFVGVPHVEKGKLEIVVPDWWFDVEAIFLDEYNRADKRVHNATMELIQFRSINGRKLPKLKHIWAAINPSDAVDGLEHEYNVNVLDLAQLDRFQMTFRIQQLLNVEYLTSRFPDHASNVASLATWYSDLPEVSRIQMSPRRVTEIISALIDGGNLKAFLPKAMSPEVFMEAWGADAKKDMKKVEAIDPKVLRSTNIRMQNITAEIRKDTALGLGMLLRNMPTLTDEQVTAVISENALTHLGAIESGALSDEQKVEKERLEKLIERLTKAPSQSALSIVTSSAMAGALKALDSGGVTTGTYHKGGSV